MAVFLGRHGNVRLRRNIGLLGATLEDQIKPDDVNTTLNRLSFDSANDNLITGDRVEISTTDARGLVCFAASVWSSAVVEPAISAYVHVNAVGGLRFFYSFENAVTITVPLS
jgi:hypothetical protein